MRTLTPLERAQLDARLDRLADEVAAITAAITLARRGIARAHEGGADLAHIELDFARDAIEGIDDAQADLAAGSVELAALLARGAVSVQRNRTARVGGFRGRSVQPLAVA